MASTLGSTSCEDMPLLAPTGSVISLFANGSVLAPNGSLDLIATVIEQGSAAGGGTGGTASSGGQPVHNGTLVTFTTTIGTIAPSEARTHNGQVTVKLTGDGRSGVASIFAYSGSAKSAELKINVGAAAVDHIILTADPPLLPVSGGTSQLSARVEDVSGSVLAGVDVTFSTTTGTIATPTVKTNSAGVATASLATTLAAKVTATCGAKSATADISIAPTVSVTLTASPATPTVDQVVTFTATATPGAGAVVTGYDWSFGDGTGTTTSGASASHVYTRSGTMTATVTARTNFGSSGIGQTIITVTPQVPISVTLAASSTSPVTNQTVTFTATTGPLPAGAVILRYDWNFGDGGTSTTTSNTATHAYATAGTKDISVRVVLSTGGGGTGVTTIVVTNPNPVTVSLSAVPNTATRGLTIVRFTASVGALPPGVSIVEYQWNFGNGVTARTTSAVHEYQYPATEIPGTKPVTVSVVLSNGTTAVGQALVNVTL